MRIEIEELSEDRLFRHVWTYSVNVGYGTPHIWVELDYYAPEVRESTRHKFKTPYRASAKYSRMEPRSYNGCGMPLDLVPVPVNLRERLLAEIASNVHIRAHGDYKEE